jgi:predicted PolB exonuclease-like 3'-5' exonuclease
MQNKKEIENLLFLDIESVPEYETTEQFKLEKPNLYDIFFDRYYKDSKERENGMLIDEFYMKRSPLYAEFSKIVCISIGKVSFNEDNTTKNGIRSITSHDEVEILNKFIEGINKMDGKFTKFAGHNIIAFDLPMIIKKCIKHNITLPHILQLHNLKPWESPLLDTMKMWQFNSYYMSSLELACEYLGLTNPKGGDVSGKNLAEFYYKTKDLDTIKKYCEGDISSTIEMVIKIYSCF